MEQPIFRIRSIASLQRKEKRIVNEIRIKDTPKSVYTMLQAEVGELGEAIETGNKFEMMCEVGDIIMLCARLAICSGFRLVDSVTGKARRNHDKYNPRALRRLQTDWGMTPDESMDFAKQRWDRSRDASYFQPLVK